MARDAFSTSACSRPSRNSPRPAGLLPSRAAKVFTALNTYGTLRVGATADVAVLELTEGSFEFVDNYKGTRRGDRRLVTRAVVFGGKRVA